MTPNSPVRSKILRAGGAKVWGAVALVFFLTPATLFVGWEISDAVGGGRDFVDNLGLVVMFGSIANVIRVALSTRKEIYQRIAENLRREYNITVPYPSLLIRTGKYTGIGLTHRKVLAIDEYRRPLTITLSLDATGTKVIPTIHEVDGQPAPGI